MTTQIHILPQDENGFKEFYFEYFPLAVRTAMYVLKEQVQAEDVAQNVFVKLWNKRGSMEEVKNLKAYVTQMAKNGALDIYNANKKFESEEKLPLRYQEDTQQDDNGLKVSIEKALAELAPQCRLIFSMSRFEGLTNPEIAEYLEISPRTVETQISNALKRFRTDLKHHFVDLLGFGLMLVESMNSFF